MNSETLSAELGLSSLWQPLEYQWFLSPFTIEKISPLPHAVLCTVHFSDRKTMLLRDCGAQKPSVGFPGMKLLFGLKAFAEYLCISSSTWSGCSFGETQSIDSWAGGVQPLFISKHIYYMDAPAVSHHSHTSCTERPFWKANCSQLEVPQMHIFLNELSIHGEERRAWLQKHDKMISPRLQVIYV